MLLFAMFWMNMFSCVDASYPKPEIPFLEDPNDDKDGDGYTENRGDCDDANPEIYPFAKEICDEIDNNCNGVIDADTDKEETPLWYQDSDGDAFGVEALLYTEPSCTRPEGYVGFFGDCDDESEDVNPDAVEVCDGVDNDCDQLVDDQDSFWLRESGEIFYGDGDGDGYGWPGFFVESCSAPPNMVLNSQDCDDTNRYISPNATEICDGIDNNCDSKIDDDDDELSVLSALRVYRDDDEDGFGNPNESILLCSVIVPYVTNKNDCDDTSPLIHPNAVEVCDDIDNNCDLFIDNEAIDFVTYYSDNDGDGFGNIETAIVICPLDEDELQGKTMLSGDCNDQNNNVFQDNDEICDSIDNNCDGIIDEGLTHIYYVDEDGDGFGGSQSIESCLLTEGYSAFSGDCNDQDSEIHLDFMEICDGKDNNCDARIDENTAVDAKDWFLDLDGDGYGQNTNYIHQCFQPIGYVEENGDCDDLDAMRFPYMDADGDGYLACETVATWNDCDDQQPSMLPFGIDLVGDDIDQNCDGFDATYHISVGKDRACGLVDGKLSCWGEELELSHSKKIRWIDITENTGDTGCFIDEGKKMTCFGDLHNLSIPNVSVSAVGVGEQHYCAILSSNIVICDGDDQYGRTIPPTTKFYHMSVGNNHNCALNGQRSIVCWGDDEFGQSSPPEGVFVQVSVGDKHSCALDEAGMVTCFGDNTNGQITAPNDRFSLIDSAWNLSCGILESGSVSCWGDTAKIAIPIEVQAQSISVGQEQVCIVDMEEEVQCFGDSILATTEVDFDGDGSTVLHDCDDKNAALTPFDVDTDGFSTCDGDCDDGNPVVGVIDADGDGYACLLDCDDTKSYLNRDDADGDGYTSCEGDCNDQNAEVSPLDADGDGYSLCDGDCRDDDASITPRDDNDGDGFTYCLDCNDDPNNGGASIYPGSAYLDSDTACMKDADGDGWGENLTKLCCLQIQLHDSYGNGWDGASLLIEQKGKFIDEVTITEGFEGSKELCLPEEGDFSLTYKSGSWNGENTYTIVDPDGNNIFSDGPFPTTVAQNISLIFDQYQEPTCQERSIFDSGADCDDNDPALTGEDKDGDGSSLCDGDCDDFDPNVSGADVDRDGYSECGGDCDDNDPLDMLDRDGDGFSLCTGDCNDYAFWTNPRSIERVQDDVDQNCDGSDQIIAVSAGSSHSCGIGLEGYVSCWGEQFAVMNTPTSDGFVMINSSDKATIGLHSNGEIECWGTRCDNLPTDSFVMIDQGKYHGCGITEDAQIVCWGDENAFENIPTGEFVQVAVGEKSSCALATTGVLECWGMDLYSEISKKPSGKYLSVKAGIGQICAMDLTDRIKCWGDETANGIPTTPVQDYSVGYRSGCVIDMNQKLNCWGLNGEIPDGIFVSVDNGTSHACGVDSENFIHCWGDFEYGKTDVDVNLCTSDVDKDGDGYLACEDDCDDTDPLIMPIDIDGDGYSPCTGDCDESNITLNGEDKDGDGSSATCDGDCNDFNSFLNTRDRDGDGWSTCSGDCDDADPTLHQSDEDADSWTSCDGDQDDTDPWSYPYAFDPIRDGIDQDGDGQDGRAIMLAGHDYSCGLDAQGRIFCFGNNDEYGQITQYPKGEYFDLDIGPEHACAINFDGNMECWGDNSFGEAGDSASVFEEPFYRIAVGRDFSCALQESGEMTCWGDSNHAVVLYEPMSLYLSLSAGEDHVCAIDILGMVECWGDDTYEQTQAPSDEMRTISAEGNRSCALSKSNDLHCWGDIQISEEIGKFQEISVGENLLCGITLDGILRCWDNLGVDVSAKIYVEGLQYSYYEIDSWNEFGDFDSLVPYKTEIDTQMSSYNQEVFDSGKTENVGLVFEGFLYSKGEDIFMDLGSDDGSRIYIDNSLFLNNDHTWQIDWQSANMYLSEGYHPFRVEYYQNSGQSYFYLQMVDNNLWKEIPKERIFHQDYISDAVQVYTGSDHYCLIYADNSYECFGSIEATSDPEPEMWCDTYLDLDGDGFSVCDGDCDDKNLFLNLNDFDGDGLTPCDGDCNDVDATIGVTDQDNDGYGDCLDDCDASDPWIRPYAIDYVGDGIDQNCDGKDQEFLLEGSQDFMCGFNPKQELICWEFEGEAFLENAPLSETILYADINPRYPCALLEDETISCWNYNVYSDSDLFDIPTSPVKQFSISEQGVGCHLDDVGNLECWGDNTPLFQDAPTGQFAKVELGFYHGCALGFDHQLQCWGANNNGQGNVPEGSYKTMKLGVESTCALDIDGKIHCWGLNTENQTDAPTGKYVELFGGRAYAWDQNYCALDKKGNVTCWGNSACELPSGVRYIHVGISSNGICGIDDEDELHCCGYLYTDPDVYINKDRSDGNILIDCLDENVYSTDIDEDGDGYSICDGDRDDKNPDINLDDVDGDGITSSDGDCDDNDANVIPIDEDGDGFSSNCDGDCDDSNPFVFPHAMDLVGDGIDQDCDGEDATEMLSVGSDNICGINAKQEIRCFSRYGPYANFEYPTEGNFVAISAGNSLTCALDEEGKVTCFGYDYYNVLSYTPDDTFVDIHVFENAACGKTIEGNVVCWGESNDKNDIPESNFVNIQQGFHYACGLDVDLNIQCWGNSQNNHLYPPIGRFQKLVSSNNAICALAQNGEILCWGLNLYGQIEVPDGTYTDVAIGKYQVCALDENQNAVCWGEEEYAPELFPMEGEFKTIAVGHGFACGFTGENHLVCWDDSREIDLDYDNDGQTLLRDCDDYNKLLTDFDLDNDGFSTCDGDRDDNNAEINLSDFDGDGVTSNDGDCDDYDADIVPIDLDHDGFSEACGEDCDDSDPFVHNYAVELVGDGIDQDCDGEDTDRMIDLNPNYGCSILPTGALTCFSEWTTQDVLSNVPEGTYTYVETSYNFACALQSNGGIECWGSDSTALHPPSGYFRQFVLGDQFGCALDSVGNVECWGENYHGVLSEVPDQSFVRLFGGRFSICGIDEQGDLSCWGEVSPYSVSYPQKQYVEVALVDGYICTLDYQHQVECFYQDGSSEKVFEGSFEKIFGGSSHMCVLDTEGNATCMGNGDCNIASNIPDISFDELTMNSCSACGLDEDQQLTCWGGNNLQLGNEDSDGDGYDKAEDCDDFLSYIFPEDQDGDGYTRCDGDWNDEDASLNLDDVDGDGFSSLEGDCEDNNPLSFPIDADGDGFSSNCDGDCDDQNILIGPHGVDLVGDGIDQDCDGQDATSQMDGTRFTNCYLQGTDTSYCWGDPLNGEVLGDGSYTYVKTGHWSVCALTTDSEIACFGSDMAVADPPEGVFKQMDISEYNGCALDENGQITCWGTGQGDVYNIPEGTFIRISKGWEHQCAIDISGEIQCWGYINTPKQNAHVKYIDLVSGAFHSCALDMWGNILCWGDSFGGKTQSPMGKFSKIYAGMYHSCALDEQGYASCWGQNDFGEIELPTDIAFTDLLLGESHTCGETRDGDFLCWGYSAYECTNPDFDDDGAHFLLDCFEYDASMGIGDAQSCPSKSCAQIKEIHPARNNGTYWINPTGAEIVQAECDMDAGGFTKIFSQDISQGGVFANETEAILYNQSNPSSDLYSLLGWMDDFVSLPNDIHVEAESYHSQSGTETIEVSDDIYTRLNETGEYIEWILEIEKDGTYLMDLHYMSISNIEFRLLMNGTKIIDDSLDEASIATIQTLDLGYLLSGNYFVRLICDDCNIHTKEIDLDRFDVSAQMNYEMILRWPNTNSNQNHWAQSNNPLQSTEVQNYYAYDTDCLTNGWRGLALSDSTSVLLDGTDTDTWYAIGILDPVMSTIPAGCGVNTSKVELWFR